MKKRILPALLALCMVMSMLPAVAFAAGSCTGAANCTATEHNANCLALCDTTASCPNDPDTHAAHQANCVMDKDNCDPTDASCGNEVHKANCKSQCTGDASCTNTANHQDDCVKLCTKNASCPNDSDTTAAHQADCPMDKANCDPTDADCANEVHQANCKSKCTGAAGCTNTANHKDGCPEACTQNASCENDPATHAKHKAGCPMDQYNCDPTNASCANEVHKDNCKSQCTGTAQCTNTENHKDGCKMDAANCTHSTACTNAVHTVVYVVKWVTDDGEPVEHTAEFTTVAAANAKASEVGGSVVAQYCPKAGTAVADVVAVEETEDPAETTDPADTTEEPTTIEKAEDFSDVEADDWYAKDLTTALEKGWIAGNADGSFGGDDETTGEMVVVLLSRVLGKDLVTTGANWTEEAIAWAAEEGLTEGIEITNGEIARKDLVLIMWRAAGSPESEQDLADFTDVDELEGDYLTAMKWAVEVEIIKGNGDGTITPDGATLRSQMVALLSRFDAAVNK